MDWWLLTFFLGAILSLFLPLVPALFYVFLFLIIFVLLFCLKKTRIFSLLFLGCAWLLFHGAQYQNIWQSNDIKTADFIHKKILVRGRIESIVSSLNESKRFNFIISHFNQQELNKNIKVRLTWKKPQQVLLQGQEWQLTIKIKPAHGLANEGGFSYQTWLRRSHIYATGYVVKVNGKVTKATNKAVRKNKNQPHQLLNNDISFRQQQYQKLLHKLPKDDLSALILALTFGERGELTKKHWRVLQATATQHLIAISGLHLGLIAVGSFTLSLLLMRYFPISLIFKYFPLFKNYRLLNLNHRKLAIAISCLITLLYAYYANFSVPTVRALLMISLLWLAKLFVMKISLTRWLLLVLVTIVIVMPFSLFSSGFWLSFYAVSVIFLFIWRFHYIFSSVRDDNKKPSITSKFTPWLKSLVGIQLCLTLLMLPLTAWLNYQLSLVAILANLVAVPLMSFTTIPLSLLAVIFVSINSPVSVFFIDLALLSLTWLWQWLMFLTEQSWALIDISAQQLLLFTLVILLLVCSMLFHFSRKALVTTLAVLVFGVTVSFFVPRTIEKSSAWQVHVMDVGQGLSVFIERNNRMMLYDTGASYPSGFNMTNSVLLPFLKYRGITKIDRLYISHDDNDHAGGLAMLNDNIIINELIYNEPFMNSEQSIGNKTVKLTSCLQGTSQHWQGLTIEMLWPVVKKGKDNDDSCVLKISDGQHRVLLTGDISKLVEAELITQYISTKSNGKNKLQAEILIAPHHGSKTSSSLAFIEAVAPKTVIFSAGYLNRWHMPVAAIVDRYHKKNIKSYNTAERGMITVEFSTTKTKIKQYRRDTWPFWFAN